MRKITLNDIDIFKVGFEIQIAGAIYNSKDHSYICMLPHEKLQKPLRLEMDNIAWEHFIKQTDYQERQIETSMQKTILRKSQRQVEQNIIWKVYKRDNYTCRYCGKEGVPLTIDHLILWEKGGPSIEKNLVTSCRSCNRIRGNTEYRKWLQSDNYKKVSKNLSLEQKKENQEVLKTLKNIKRLKTVRSR